MAARSCMGGWCEVRDRCALHIGGNRSRPSERLCEIGTHDAFVPVRNALLSGWRGQLPASRRFIPLHRH